jgi:hypothetical protein
MPTKISQLKIEIKDNNSKIKKKLNVD